MYKQRGMTLVEVLITMTILTLVLALSYQSLSVFLKAAGNSNSLLRDKQQEIITRVALRNSVAGMLDYYVKNDEGLYRPYFYNSASAIQYVSSSPMVFKSSPEVFVFLEKVEWQRGEKLNIWECPLDAVLPYTQQEFSIKYQQCIEVSGGLERGAISLSAELQAAGEVRFSILNPTQTENSETAHLLPKSISILLGGEGEENNWTFRTRVENLMKFYQIQGAGINV